MKVQSMMVATGFLMVVLSACGGTTAPTAVSGNNSNGGSKTVVTPSTPPDLAPSADEQRILDEVNAARAVARNCGSTHYDATTPLTWNALLAAAALRHTQDMAYNGYREASAQEPDAPHTGSDGSTPQQRITAAGYDWRVSGENVAAGYALADMVTAWLNSPGHCQNIMNPKFREIGISYMSYRGAKYNTFYTQDFGVR